MNSKPQISIFCFTYNHAKYIRDAIDGFLMQKIDRELEIIIHDDASTDDTIRILKEYERQYPELIHVIYETENQYSKYKYPPRFSYYLMKKEARGDYIAICEGDDYWTDPGKLQMQTDYMESHPDCVMTGHDAELLNCRTGEKKRLELLSGEMDMTADDLINGIRDITSASMVFRREILDMDSFFLDMKVGDYPLKLYSLTKGKIHYFDKVMSVYRYLSEGSWSCRQRSDFKSYLIRWTNKFVFLEKYNKYTYEAYSLVIKKLINNRINTLLRELSDLSIEQFSKMCQSCDKDSDYEAHKYYAAMINLFRQYHDVNYIDDKVKEFAKRNNSILIYGVGVYGKLAAEQLVENNVEFEGFVVSDDRIENKYWQGKQIRKLSELQCIKDRTGILIAVGPQLVSEILAALRDNGITNYIYPFEVCCDELME